MLYGKGEMKDTTNIVSSKRYYLEGAFKNIYLTERERQVASMLSDCTYAQIADKFGISVRTVEVYVRNMRIKLNCQNKKALIALLARLDSL